MPAVRWLGDAAGHPRATVSRLPAGPLPNRRVLAGDRQFGQRIAGPGRGAACLGGGECLQAVPVAPPGDCHHGAGIVVHRARLGAEAAVGRGGALLGFGTQGQHFIASSWGRLERDHLDQAGVLGHGISLPPAEGSCLHSPDFRAAAVSERAAALPQGGRRRS